MPHDTQSVIAGVLPPPEVEGSTIAVTESPPNSPATTPRWVPCATAIPLAPAARNDSDRLCTWEGALHVPGAPAVNAAGGVVMSAMYTLDGPLNSTGARATCVEQSSP